MHNTHKNWKGPLELLISKEAFLPPLQHGAMRVVDMLYFHMQGFAGLNEGSMLTLVLPGTRGFRVGFAYAR
jgi:hypothetical protein